MGQDTLIFPGWFRLGQGRNPDQQPAGPAEMEAVARSVIAAMPDLFRDLLADVVIDICEFPDARVMHAMGLTSPYDLLGLFEGNGLAQTGGASWTGKLPNRIWLYRRPILAYWHEHPDTLEAIIAHVLIHEIGHHFGLSDEDMDRIERGGD